MLKPFVYALALDEGLIHPSSLLQDVPRRTGDYRHGNFDSGFHGPISMSEATGSLTELTCSASSGGLRPKKICGEIA